MVIRINSLIALCSLVNGVSVLKALCATNRCYFNAQPPFSKFAQRIYLAKGISIEWAHL